ncbi:ectonucleoside triphosphate diphosphohydrolase 5-like [Paramacrobiotus metropolitanus]|uniref:ectonucleoside triphosphate diphosphohydrolase 5-like n=1 Tax=Paramacrobiotus metropolitanus TaxID=2943436 RepID=UPI0024465A51|nr:ectonucleoside triphosphate diphosphohydrolase 5-like [Paramacrobiotus metropolitanus]
MPQMAAASPPSRGRLHGLVRAVFVVSVVHLLAGQWVLWRVSSEPNDTDSSPRNTPFWSQDVHSHFPFSEYAETAGPSFLAAGHYSSRSAFKRGYAVEERVSGELPQLRSRNYTGSLYGIIIDAGSTGTRLSAFHFVKAARPPFMRLISECGKHVKPGLSYYAAEPASVVHNLAPLVARAKDCVPPYAWKSTPLELKATAGLRLLPAFVQDRILDHAKAWLHNESPFVLSHDDAISIMEGIDEGLYSWITVNFLLNTLHHHYDTPDECLAVAEPDAEQNTERLFRREQLKRQTFGTLDLGGGSMQITFVPLYDQTIDEAPPDRIHHVKIFGERLKLYSWSYLGFGLMSARMQMFGFPLETPLEAVQTVSNVLSSPCILSPHPVPWEHASTEYRVHAAPSADPFAACAARASLIVSRAIHHQPEVARESFYAFSYFYDIAVEARIIPHVAGGQVPAGVFRSTAEAVCREGRGEGRPFLCMDLCYISALLLEGLGLRVDQDVVLRKKIDGVETSWALGAMFHMLNTFHNTSNIDLGR